MATNQLTYRQRQFVAFYLGKASGNATEAARLAGYAQPHSQGPRLLDNVGVSAAIDAKLDDAALRSDEILARLSDHATGSLEDFIKINAKGAVTIDLKKAQELGRLHCLKKLKKGKFGWEFEMYDAQSALDKLAKFRRLYESVDPLPSGEAKPRLIIPGSDERSRSRDPR